MGAANGAMMGREERERRRMARMPDEVADVVERRLANRVLDGKINRDGGMYRMQESFDEPTTKRIDQLLGLGKKPPPKAPEEEATAESWFMRKKIAERDKLDWENPEKKAMRRTEAVDDQGKHIIRMTCDYSTGATPWQLKASMRACHAFLPEKTVSVLQATRLWRR